MIEPAAWISNAKKPTNITCTVTALKYLQLRFRPSFRLYLVSTSCIVPFKTTTSYTEHKTRKSKYESKKLKHRNQNVIAQNTMSHIGFRINQQSVLNLKTFLHFPNNLNRTITFNSVTLKNTQTEPPKYIIMINETNYI